MKIKSIIFGLTLLIGILGVSMTVNKIEVPTAVKNAFSQKYPDAKKVEWELEKEGEFEAEFKLNKIEMSANFKEDGTWVGTETEMNKGDLPQAVKNAIAAKFPGYEIEEAELTEKPEGVNEYEVELENEKDDSELKAVFSGDGMLIKKEMENGDDNDDGDDDNDDNDDGDDGDDGDDKN